jgi:lipoate-protein ligase A
MTSESWYLLDSGPGPYAFNMGLDEALLEASSFIGHPILRYYGWTEAAASFGYLQKYSEIERLTILRPLVRRPTAGGLVPHDHDWTYTFIFPPQHAWYSLRALETYRRVHASICDAFADFGFAMELASDARTAGPGQCFVGYEKFDVLFRGQKIAGAAQRRRRDGLLIQGSVQPGFVEGVGRMQWQEAFCQAITRTESIAWQLFTPAQHVLSRASSLMRTKYSTETYNRRR